MRCNGSEAYFHNFITYFDLYADFIIFGYVHMCECVCAGYNESATNLTNQTVAAWPYTLTHSQKQEALTTWFNLIICVRLLSLLVD